MDISKLEVCSGCECQNESVETFSGSIGFGTSGEGGLLIVVKEPLQQGETTSDERHVWLDVEETRALFAFLDRTPRSFFGV